MPKSIGPRIVTLDIETAPIEAFTWGIWEQNIGLDMVKTDWSILSFSAKWLGEKKVTTAHTGGRGADKVRDDYELLKKLWVILDEADIVVTQNGKAFDIKKINYRMLLLGLGPYSPIKVIDTMLEQKRSFAPTSTKLAFATEKLTKAKKLKHKKFPGFELWRECLRDNPSAWAEMVRYNAADVVSTEQLYLRLRPWIPGHPNIAAYTNKTKPACPKCASTRLKSNGMRTTQSGRYRRYLCLTCGGSCHGKASLSSKEERAALLGN